MTKREKMISILVRRTGGMRTMLLTGLINNFPKRAYSSEGGTDTLSAWFPPQHNELQRKLGIKPPVYWALIRGLCDRGLLHKRVTDKHGHEYQIDFGAIEAYCKWGRLELAVRWLKRMTIGVRNLFKGGKK